MFLYYYETAVFVKSRRAYYENITLRLSTCCCRCFSFERVTRREISSSIISECDCQRIRPAVQRCREPLEENWQDKIINLHICIFGPEIFRQRTNATMKILMTSCGCSRVFKSTCRVCASGTGLGEG